MSLKFGVVIPRQTHTDKFNHVEGRNFLGMGRTPTVFFFFFITLKPRVE